MIELDDRSMRPTKLPRISLDTRLLAYKDGFRHGIIIGAVVSLSIMILFLVFR